MSRFFFFIILSLAGCQSTSGLHESTFTFEFQGRYSHAWVSNKFDGTHSRQIQDDTLTFTVQQSAVEGGLDVGLSTGELRPVPVKRVAANASICSSYDIDLSGEGRWWAGPKISVNWQGDESAKQNGDDWYENYVIEIASTTPEELHDLFTGDYFDAEILPDAILAGSTYRNYKIRFHDWWQFWTVRQDYRESGTVPIKPILNLWVDHGLPEGRQFDGVKANIETYGQLIGTGRIAVDDTAELAKVLECGI